MKLAWQRLTEVVLIVKAPLFAARRLVRDKSSRLAIIKDWNQSDTWLPWAKDASLSNEEFQAFGEWISHPGSNGNITALMELKWHLSKNPATPPWLVRRLARKFGDHIARGALFDKPLDIRTALWLAKNGSGIYDFINLMAERSHIPEEVFLYCFRRVQKEKRLTNNWGPASTTYHLWSRPVAERLWKWAVKTKNNTLIEEITTWSIQADPFELMGNLLKLPIALRPKDLDPALLKIALLNPGNPTGPGALGWTQKDLVPKFTKWFFDEMDRTRTTFSKFDQAVNQWCIEDPEAALAWQRLPSDKRPALNNKALAKLLLSKDKRIREIGIAAASATRPSEKTDYSLSKNLAHKNPKSSSSSRNTSSTRPGN